MISVIRHSLALLFSVLVAACGSWGETPDETRGWSAQKLYTEAKDSLNNGQYAEAIKYYEKLESRYPYSRLAQQAQMDTAYAYYKDHEPAQALAAVDRFIKMYPNHPNVDYILYLKSLIHFSADLGFTGMIGGQDPTERDPKAVRDAFDALRDLTTRFPASRYAPDAIARMHYLVNALASHEIHVARYYMTRGAYVAAASRAQFALKTYPRAPANEEGLVILLGAYDALGMKDLREDTQRVLIKNFPDSKALKGDRGPSGSWWQIWN